jgi:hypothetical protein
VTQCQSGTAPTIIEQAAPEASVKFRRSGFLRGDGADRYARAFQRIAQWPLAHRGESWRTVSQEARPSQARARPAEPQDTLDGR